MGADMTKRDKTRMVTYKVPTSCAVQIYDHQKQKGRIVFGPNLVSLGPSEEFNTWSLSAGRPKKTNVVKCLVIMLGNYFLLIFTVVGNSGDHFFICGINTSLHMISFISSGLFWLGLNTNFPNSQNNLVI